MVDEDKKRQVLARLEKDKDKEKDIESARKTIYDLRLRGASWQMIANVVGMTRENVRYHHKQLVKQKYEETTGVSRSQVVGDTLKRYEKLENDAFLAVSSCELGSPSQLHWINMLLKLIGQRTEFMERQGLIEKPTTSLAAIEGNIEKMNVESIEDRIQEVKGLLSGSQVENLTLKSANIELSNKIKALEEMLKASGKEIEL